MIEISVIVPIYNVEKYLCRCIDSILAQTYPHFQLILVDDGSPDNCGRICDDYAQKDSRVTVVHQENGGLSAARNAGLNVATGKYVYFCDSDDYLDVDMFEQLAPYISKDYDIVSFGYEAFFDSGKKTFFLPKESDYHFHSTDDKYQFIVNYLLRYKISWAACMSLRKREIVKKNNINFVDTRLIFAEDMLFSLCYCSFSSSVAVVSKPFYHYYQRENSIMDISKHQLLFNRMNNLSKYYYSVFSRCEDNSSFNQYFSTIHYLIFMNVLQKEKKENRTLKEIRHEMIDNIEDWDFFSSHLFRYIECNTIEESKKNELLYLLSGKTIHLLRIKLRGLLSKIKRFIVKTGNALKG